ncbi:MAG: hypothetical protein ACNA8W_14835 [Bradymonadaceae bacterium]
MIAPPARRPVLPPLIWFALCAALLVLPACETERSFDPTEPARGPGGMVGSDSPLHDGPFAGGDDSSVAPREVAARPDQPMPDCGAECLSYCRDLNLTNPANRGLCTSLWGVGLEPRAVDRDETCRRLHADLLGRFPTRQEVLRTCGDRPWSEIVRDLIDEPDFVLINQRRWADRFLYNPVAVSVERIYDMDRLVGKLYRGEVSYDLFASVASAHPVLTRRHDTAQDRAAALFHLFLGRPPLGHERSDIARLYGLWHNGYYDHPHLGMRLSDSFIEYRCVDDNGEVDEDSKGECTSILYGYNELILQPDIRVEPGEDRMWSGLLRADEWQRLQLPGRLLAQQPTFWEKAVDDVIDQYLAYELGTMVPEVRDELVRYLLAHEGDIRALHYAVATSAAYLQSAASPTPSDHRWTYGPLKQVDPELWIDSIKSMTGYELSRCDHRISDPRDLVNAQTVASMALLENSRWEFRDDGDVRRDYRDLAQNLGGCPVNDVGGRFKIVSILTTATQLNFVNEVCNPALDPDGPGIPVDRLLPPDVNAERLVTPDLAEVIVRYQINKFYGRQASSGERQEARDNGDLCERQRCRAEEFARPVCFALLSSSEMLFY